jgi:hypothetical protein
VPGALVDCHESSVFDGVTLAGLAGPDQTVGMVAEGKFQVRGWRGKTAMREGPRSSLDPARGDKGLIG